MTEDDIIAHIASHCAEVQIEIDRGNHFFFAPGEKKFPFVTLVISDQYDKASDLNRPGVYRLNIGIEKETYHSHFGRAPGWAAPDGVVDTGHDFTALDQLMPHPVYAPMNWICALSPSGATFETLKPLLAEAYEIAVKRSRSDPRRPAPCLPPGTAEPPARRTVP
ncbi:DUF6194 family protein [Luteolibacter sp. Populi]|uniref:DUF6194 family protein n=1 Tax=Luteolibacter sp. Populi TaxID=3230487 RepID=UPI0034654627